MASAAKRVCHLSSVLCCLLPAMASAEEAAQHGMPQLDFANPLTISQIVWLVVVFAVLYALLSTWALPKVGAVIGDRATRIAADLDSARAAKAAADEAAREVREASAKAHASSQAEIAAAVDAAKRDAGARAARQQEDLDARIAASEARIATARAAAMASLRGLAGTVASTMIERLCGHPADPHAVDAAVSRLLPTEAA